MVAFEFAANLFEDRRLPSSIVDRSSSELPQLGTSREDVEGARFAGVHMATVSEVNRWRG